MALLSLVLVLAAWEGTSILAGINPRTNRNTVPSIEEVFGEVKALGHYWKGGLGVEATAVGGDLTWAGAGLSVLHNSAMTGLRMAAGLSLGIAASLSLVLLIGWSRFLRSTFELPGHFARMMPLLAMIPLFQLWFGQKILGSIIFVAFAVSVLIFAIGINAIGNVPQHYQQYARSLGASSVRTYLTVIFPATLPQLRAAFLLALGFSWSAAIASEIIGQRYGLGRIVVLADFFGRTNLMAMTGLIVVLYSAVSFLVASRFLNWLTRWAE